jgi:phosphohistidine phosphatase SixA
LATAAQEELMADVAREWTGIMRHAEAFRPGMDPDQREPGTTLTKAGWQGAVGVGARLAETLTELDIGYRGVTIVCGPSPEAKGTAVALARQLPGTLPVKSLELLAPTSWTRHSNETAETRWKKIREKIGDTDAVVLVGHDPQVSWLLHHLAAGRQQPRAGQLPLGRGELAMLAGRAGQLELQWVISPSDDKLIEDLRDKIRSKMDTAKLLGAFLTALLVFAARELAAAENPPSWHPWVAGAGLALLGTATAAYFVTMFLYDGLLMPVRMWPSPKPSSRQLPRGFVQRPPSSAAWVLYQNMMRVWSNAFVPATALGGAGALLVTIALARPSDDLGWIAVVVTIAALIAGTWLIPSVAPRTSWCWMSRAGR